mmetsp:Transcript_70917/g.188704  ORF Transcript_70917/g.188704 Transcript_70917/m.188704 type:complete len:227 (+) Transcript_70917:711-1391(+)
MAPSRTAMRCCRWCSRSPRRGSGCGRRRNTREPPSPTTASTESTRRRCCADRWRHPTRSTATSSAPRRGRRRASSLRASRASRRSSFTARARMRRCRLLHPSRKVCETLCSRAASTAASKGCRHGLHRSGRRRTPPPGTRGGGVPAASVRCRAWRWQRTAGATPTKRAASTASHGSRGWACARRVRRRATRPRRACCRGRGARAGARSSSSRCGGDSSTLMRGCGR